MIEDRLGAADAPPPPPPGARLLGELAFGAATGAALMDGAARLSVPMLPAAPPPRADRALLERLFVPDAPASARRIDGPAEAEIVLAECGAWAMLAAAVDAPEDAIAEAAAKAYDAALAAMAAARNAPRLVRAWNFLPAINGPDAHGLERYRAFCAGRARAWDGAFQDQAAGEAQMSAATGVGCRGSGPILFCLLAGPEARHLENPLQIPAFRYPQRYGPRSPSFARATAVPSGAETRPRLFVSGTASIRGHESVHIGDLEGQLDVTLENIRALAGAENLASAGLPGGGFALEEARHVKAYVRRAEDVAAVARRLDAVFGPSGVEIGLFVVDICREDLLVEIETVF